MEIIATGLTTAQESEVLRKWKAVHFDVRSAMLFPDSRDELISDMFISAFEMVSQFTHQICSTGSYREVLTYEELYVLINEVDNKLLDKNQQKSFQKIHSCRHTQARGPQR